MLKVSHLCWTYIGVLEAGEIIHVFECILCSLFCSSFYIPDTLFLNCHLPIVLGLLLRFHSWLLSSFFIAHKIITTVCLLWSVLTNWLNFNFFLLISLQGVNTSLLDYYNSLVVWLCYMTCIHSQQICQSYSSKCNSDLGFCSQPFSDFPLLTK